MTYTATDATARALGFTLPTGTDLIKSGDDAISQNARTAAGGINAAIRTVDNLTVAATTLDYGQPATATITGSVPNKTITMGIPAGAPGMGYAEGQQLTAAAAQSAADAATALAAQFMTQDEGVTALIETAAGPLTQSALDNHNAALLGDPGTATRGAMPAAVEATEAITRRAPGVRYRPVAGTLRKASGVWAPIDDAGHTPNGVASVSATSTYIRVTFDHTATKVGTFLCGVDEQYAKEGYSIGASVAVGHADIYLYRASSPIGGYVSFDGTAWTTPYPVFRNFSWSGNTLYMEHDHVEPFGTNLMVSVVGRGAGAYIYRVGSIYSSVTRVEVYDLTGAPVTTPATDMKLYVYRGSAGSVAVNPLTMPEGWANLWISGMNEITDPTP